MSWKPSEEWAARFLGSAYNIECDHRGIRDTRIWDQSKPFVQQLEDMRHADSPNPSLYPVKDLPYDNVGRCLGDTSFTSSLHVNGYGDIIDSLEEMVELYRDPIWTIERERGINI